MTTATRRRYLPFLFLALGVAALPVAMPLHALAQLETPLNNAESTLASDHVSGSGTLVLATGTGTRFGTPTVDAPVRVTVARRPTMVSGVIKPGTTYTIYLATARTGDTLSGLTAVEGTSDRAYFRNDPVVSLITAGTISGLQDVVEAIDVDLTGAFEAIDTKADDVAVLKIATAQDITGAKQALAPFAHRVVLSADPVTFGAGAAVKIQQDKNGVAAGHVAMGVWQTNETAPFDLQTYIRDDGAFYTGRYIVSNQKRGTSGEILQVGEGSMGDFSADGNYSGVTLENTTSHGANAYALAVRNMDDLDTRYPTSANNPGTGKKVLAISPSGEIVWGPDLHTDPETRRDAKLYVDRTGASPVMRLLGVGGAYIPFATAPIVPNNVGLRTYKADNAAVANLIYQNDADVVTVGNSGGSMYVVVKDGGFLQFKDASGNVGATIQWPAKSADFGGPVSATGTLKTTGPSGQIGWEDRTAANLQWISYGDAGTLRLYNGGDKVTFATTGTTFAAGITAPTFNPTTRPSSTGQTAGFTAGAGSAVLSDSTFTGGLGATAYTIGDLVKHLKTVGILTQ